MATVAFVDDKGNPQVKGFCWTSPLADMNFLADSAKVQNSIQDSS
jgi:hypothetical protein